MSEELTEREAIVDQVIEIVKILHRVEDFGFIDNLIEMGKRLGEIDEDHLTFDELNDTLGRDEIYDNKGLEDFIARLNEARDKSKISDEEHAELMEWIEDVYSDLRDDQ